MSDKLVKIGAGNIKVDTLDLIKRVMDAQKIKVDDEPSQPACIVVGSVSDDDIRHLNESLAPLKLIVVDCSKKSPSYNDVMEPIRIDIADKICETMTLTCPERIPMPKFKGSGWRRNEKRFFGKREP